MGWSAIATADPEPVFALEVSVAPSADGSPVRSAEWIDDRVSLAEHVFAPLGVHFRIAHSRVLDRSVARIEDSIERDRYAGLVVPKAINVFLVESLRDDTVKDLYRMGVTWDSRTTPSQRFIILSADAVRSSLAHELGHFMGIQAHSNVKNNLMGYDRVDDLVFLDPAQKSLVIARARVLQSSATLVPVAWFTPSS